MYKNSTYKEKMEALREWTPSIIETVKRDLKNEHLKQDFLFSKKYLQGKNLNKLTLEDLVQGYTQAIAQEEGGEKIAEFIANRWMIQSSELYGFFERELSKVNPDFDAIQELEEGIASALINSSSEQFGADRTYIFSVINSVAFKKKQFEELQKRAAEEAKAKAKQEAEAKEVKSLEEAKLAFEQKLARLEDKYEKKLEGLQKKYLKDTEMLKKQVATLQRKMSS